MPSRLHSKTIPIGSCSTLGPSWWHFEDVVNIWKTVSSCKKATRGMLLQASPGPGSFLGPPVAYSTLSWRGSSPRKPAATMDSTSHTRNRNKSSFFQFVLLGTWSQPHRSRVPRGAKAHQVSRKTLESPQDSHHRHGNYSYHSNSLSIRRKIDNLWCLVYWNLDSIHTECRQT